jgi:hypothetical protein
MQGGFKVKRSLFSLALAALAAAAAVPASAQIGTVTIPAFERGFFNLAEAYPCAVRGYTVDTQVAPVTLGITDSQIFSGGCTATALGLGGAPGILSLGRRPGTFILDVNCFAVTPPNEFGCVVQAYRLFKKVPGSFKCPDVYGTPHFSGTTLVPYVYSQFGTGVRTWWSLNFTQPGTEFCLQVISACQFQQAINGRVVQGVHIHKDNWRWRVVADVNTLQYVIELMHGGAVSTLEIPCILGEDMYEALKTARANLATAIASGVKSDIGNRIFDFEALIVANCLFVEVLNPTVFFPGTPQFTDVAGYQPPGNLAQTVPLGPGGSAVAGIIDTIEHPCCCKLLVDLEYISIKQGLIGQTPTLPVF